MPQILIKPENIKGDRFVIEGKEAHHLLRVLRCKINETFHFFDGQGQKYTGVLLKTDPGLTRAEGQITHASSSSLKPYFFRLIQGLPKLNKMDFVIEKAVELGVDEIIPFVSQKSPIKLSADQGKRKQERWAKLVTAAAKQSGGSQLPTIKEPCALTDLQDKIRNNLSFVFHSGPSSRPLKRFLEEGILMRSEDSGISTKASILNILIGPESGFSDKELEWLKSLGAHTLSLGDLTLRSETAGLVALAVLSHELL